MSVAPEMNATSPGAPARAAAANNRCQRAIELGGQRGRRQPRFPLGGADTDQGLAAGFDINGLGGGGETSRAASSKEPAMAR